MFWHKLFGSNKSESDNRIASQSEFAFMAELKPVPVLPPVLPHFSKPAPSLKNDLGPIHRLGRIAVSAGARKMLSGQDVLDAVLQHMRGAWGGVKIDDHLMFSPADLEHRLIAAAYRSREGIVFRIVTEADRSRTTISMPEEAV